jgi:hypothetical protein
MSRAFRVTLACLVPLLLGACQKEQSVVAPTLSASCAANPAAGAAPLSVTFQLNVSGAAGPFSVAVNYGDGQSGTSPDAPHSYLAAGSYSVSFDVSTSTQSARCSTAVTVTGGTSATSGNQPPHAVFKSTPEVSGGKITGAASPLDVIFNMCASSDPEGDQLYFLYDFDGDGHFDFGGITGAHCRTDHVYTTGSYVAENCLYDRDQNGKALHDDICKSYVIVVP